MKIQLIGIRRQSGLAKETNNPYDIPMLLGLVPINNFQNEKTKIQGKGYEVANIPYDVSQEAVFMQLEFPVKVDLVVDSVPRFGEFQTVAVGYNKI